jgi:hypothetical protein
VTATDEFEHFTRLCNALKPWLGEIVIVGGWAHRLYRLHELAQPLDYQPLMTLDTDIAVPKNLPVHEQNIAQRLHEHGFTQSFLGDHQPPVTQYRLGSEQDGFYAEFLTPLLGSGYTRDGKPAQTTRIAGVSSQKLRHLDFLLRDPWKISLNSTDEVQAKTQLPIHVANATAFIVQKLLIRDMREKDRLAKDVLYIHDTIEVFGAKLERLNELWRNSVRPKIHRNHVAKAMDSVAILFSVVNDTIRDASLIARSAGREIPPEDLQAVCRAGLDLILSEPQPHSER